LAPPAPRPATPPPGPAPTPRLAPRAPHLRAPGRLGRGALALVAVAMLLGGFMPATAAAGTISGTVFEDINYAGGAGRNMSLAGGIPVAGARVEIFDGVTGLFKGSTTTGPTRTHTSSQGAGSFIVRVVGRSVASSRIGYSPGMHFPVSTYRTNASSGVALGVVNEIGGHIPAMEDAAIASGASQLDVNTFAFQIGPVGVAQD